MVAQCYITTIIVDQAVNAFVQPHHPLLPLVVRDQADFQFKLKLQGKLGKIVFQVY